MTRLPLSIIIPCSNDVKLRNCIRSIDEDVEIVVALNKPSETVRKIVSDFQVVSCEIDEKNLPRAINTGIAKSKYDKIILIDSDCLFDRKAISIVYKQLQKHNIVKGYVQYKNNGIQSSIVASYREYVNYHPPKPYCPFLCFNKKIKPLIGGYFFNESIYWTEDADLQLRLVKANIPVFYSGNAVATHVPLNFGQDLRSAFRYGTGKAMRVKQNIAKGIGLSLNKVYEVYSIKGLQTALYSVIWNISYLCGYIYKNYSYDNRRYFGYTRIHTKNLLKQARKNKFVCRK